MRKSLTVSLAAIAAIAAGSAASAQEAPKREPRPPMTRADVEQRTNQTFARMDANKDGVLDQADRAAREKAAFDRIDANGDGAISPEEFAARGDQRREASQARAEDGQRQGPRQGSRMGRRGGSGAMGFGLARNADTDGDGAVTQAEFASAALARFDSVDANKDGTISREERRAQRRDRSQQGGKHRDHRRQPEAG